MSDSKSLTNLWLVAHADYSPNTKAEQSGNASIPEI